MRIKTPSIGVGGPINNHGRSIIMKFTNNREIDYKKVVALKKKRQMLLL